MKILVLANNDEGLYKFRKELLERLISEHHTVYISLPGGKYVAGLIDAGCNYIETEFSRRGTNPFKDLRLLKKYRDIMKSIKPDIVFTYTIKPNIYGGFACAFLNIPYVANITGLGTAVEGGGLLQKIALTMYRYGLRKAQKVFFQNTENRDYMLKHKIIKVPYDLLPGSGVNTGEYSVLPYPDSETTEFVFISRIMKEKGIELYLETAKTIRKKYPETRFHICGEFEQADKYETEINALHADGTVTYHGSVEDIREIHKISSCTIHPTYYPEGLSNVLLESCACGRPIITTDRSGCREVVADGVNGYMIPQKDLKALIGAVEKFIALSNDEKRQMGLAGREKVEKDFDRNIVIEKYMKELDNTNGL